MSNLKRKFFVDVLCFVSLIFTIETGVVLKYFVKGHGSFDKSKFIGFTRSEWSNFHSFFVIVFLIALVVHIKEHDQFIKVMSKKSMLNVVTKLLILAVFLSVIILSFFTF